MMRENTTGDPTLQKRLMRVTIALAAVGHIYTHTHTHTHIRKDHFRKKVSNPITKDSKEKGTSESFIITSGDDDHPVTPNCNLFRH